MRLSEVPLNDMGGVERGGLRPRELECGESEKKPLPLSLHEEHGRSLCAKMVIKRAT